jgi:hypothetical protein
MTTIRLSAGRRLLCAVPFAVLSGYFLVLMLSGFASNVTGLTPVLDLAFAVVALAVSIRTYAVRVEVGMSSIRLEGVFRGATIPRTGGIEIRDERRVLAWDGLSLWSDNKLLARLPLLMTTADVGETEEIRDQLRVALR